MRPDHSAAYVRDVIATLEQHIHPTSSACYAMSNHDKPRVATRWQDGRDREQNAKAMLALLLAMRGDICLYQGEELGLPQSEVPFERLQDPFGITFWPKFKGRDGCRTPMPWSGERHGGFSSAEPWLPVDPAHIEINVSRQEADPDSMLHFARALIELRKSRSELSEGTITLLDAPEGVLAFARRHEDRELVCLFNMDAVEKKIDAPRVAEMVLAQNARMTNGEMRLGVNGFCLLDAG
jgi:alpha-glucosidase